MYGRKCSRRCDVQGKVRQIDKLFIGHTRNYKEKYIIIAYIARATTGGGFIAESDHFQARLY